MPINGRRGRGKEARREADTGHDCDVLTVQYPYLYHVFRETLRRHTIVPTMLREAETVPAQ
ncbi:MAG: hypothetical protein ACLPTZ_22160 [Beijerinckiaceae bacterium]